MPRQPRFDAPRFHQARYRLFGTAGGGRRRTLVLGPAILTRPSVVGPWMLAVRPEGPLEPAAPDCPEALTLATARLRSRGIHHRVASAVAVPGDFQRRRIPTTHWLLRDRRDAPLTGRMRPVPRRAIYGWALAYRPSGTDGPALVDPHEEFPDLPAFYESAPELLDRIAHLECRGIETRPIALLVHKHDFVQDDRGRRINRYFPTVAGPGTEALD